MKEHPSALPPQPADSAIAIAISKAIKEWDGKGEDPAPAKLAIVLSHRYSPDGLKDMTNLKGTDRGLAELILAARHCIPKTHDEVPSLQKLAAAVLVNEETEGYPAVNTVISDALVEGEDITSEPQFDAYLALAIIWDCGEASPRYHNPDESYHTTGPLVPLLLSDPPLALDLKAPLPMDKKALEPAYEGYGDIRLALIRSLSGNHSLKILSEEFLTDRNPSDWIDGPGDVEFLGNGMPYMGNAFSRACIVLWPRENRKKVSEQALGLTMNPFFGMDLHFDY
jgi:hypothetical protein